MNSESISLHKAKHLLSHVLVAAGRRLWPLASLGESGETSTGFYADFGLADRPARPELSLLTDEMARVLRDFSSFREVQLTPTEAMKTFHGQRWKLRQIAAIAETDLHISCYELDGVFDLCDCTIKNPRELRSVHPEKFIVTEAEPVSWNDRGQTQNFIRITGELFPAVEPCECCPHC